MMIYIPSEIFAECFFENISTFGAVHGNVMLESVLAEQIKKLLKSRDFTNPNTAITFYRVICEFSFTDISLDKSLGFVGTDTSVSHITRGDSAFYSSETIVTAKRLAEDIEIRNFDITAHEASWIITTMSYNTFIPLFFVIIIPVDKAGRIAVGCKV